jgi:hypothetical protein
MRDLTGEGAMSAQLLHGGGAAAHVRLLEVEQARQQDGKPGRRHDCCFCDGVRGAGYVLDGVEEGHGQEVVEGRRRIKKMRARHALGYRRQG